MEGGPLSWTSTDVSHESDAVLAGAPLVNSAGTASDIDLVGVDIGGTFTDFVLLRNGVITVHKRPSTPDEPERSLLEGLDALGLRDGAIVLHGSTVATNAVLVRGGARTALVTTHGFTDVIEIGRQARPSLYDLHQTRLDPLVHASLRLGVAERVNADGSVSTPLTDTELGVLTQKVAACRPASIAVCLLFSFLHPDHERQIGTVLMRQLPHVPVSLSCDINPEFREYERTSTTVLNAYVLPIMRRYVERLEAHLGSRLRIMQSAGTMMSPKEASEQPVRTLLSGPAGGVVGAVWVGRQVGKTRLLTIDIGGTSTDVALCDDGVRMTTEGSVGGLPVSLPMLDVHTIGAGGGSIARLDAGGALRVGPQSAGAVPGPACYGIGEEPTVTDALVVLGRIPATTRLAGSRPIDGGRARAAIAVLASSLRLTVEATAEGILHVVNAGMERALKVMSVERGTDPRDCALVACGGAGPLHACDLAESLGMTTVIIPPHPGVVAALGLLAADDAKEVARTVMAVPDDVGFAYAASVAQELHMLAASSFRDGQVAPSVLTSQCWLDIRYRGQSFEIRVPWPDGAMLPEIIASFHALHHRYGHAMPERAVELVTVRVRVTAPSRPLPVEHLPPMVHAVQPTGTVVCWYVGAWIEAVVYRRSDLLAGHTISGPAIIEQLDTTTWLSPAWYATVHESGALLAHSREGTTRAGS